MKRLLRIIAVIVAVSGCNLYDIDEVLLQKEDISLTIKGVDQIIYTPETFQIGHNSKTNTFRVYDDELANWFILTCDERPTTVDQEVTASLSWTESNTTKSRNNLIFKVEKTGPSGHIWLWCKDETIGIVVREL